MELFQASESAFCVVAANSTGGGKCMADLGTSKHREISDVRRAVGYGGIRRGKCRLLAWRARFRQHPRELSAQ